VVVGARKKLRSTLPTLILTPLKSDTQFICGLGCTLLNPTQVLLNQLLTHHSSFMVRSQIEYLLLQLSDLIGSMQKITLERTTHLAQGDKTL
jgi:hypothetical protein